MRSFRCIGIGIVAIGLAVGAAADHHEGAGHDQGLMEEVEAIGAKLQEAMLADDVDAMLSMYVEDAISLPNFGPRIQGVEAFIEHHEQMAAAGMEIHSFESDPTEVWAAGDHVIEIGTYKISLTPPGMSEPIDDVGKYLTVYVRDEDGALKIKAETWNTDMNPMEMGAPSEE